MAVNLNEAVEAGDLAMVKKLVKSGADANEIYRTGISVYTPLASACRKGHYQVAKLLIEAGAEVNKVKCRTRLCSLPFALACLNGRYSVAKLLLDNGADVRSGKDHLGWALLHDACNEGFFRIAKLLVEEAGADVNEPTTGARFTPLYLSTRNKHDTLSEYLVERGADVDQANWTGITPLSEACSRDSRSAVQLLLDKGADGGVGNDEGTLPIHRACSSGHLAIAQLLTESEHFSDLAWNY